MEKNEGVVLMGKIAVYDNKYCIKPRIIKYGNCRYSFIKYLNDGYLFIRLRNKITSTSKDD